MEKNNQKFGLLCYNTSYNLGDEIQSIAAKQFLPTIDALVDRDTNIIYYLNDEAKNSNIKVIYNGWFDGQYCQFPPNDLIKPLFISFHINETDHSKDSTYDILNDKKITFKPIISNEDYLKVHSPIGCRDLHTFNLLNEKKINCYFSACLTLTLKNKYMERNEDILVVDSHILCPKLFEDIIPKEIRSKAKYITQAITKILPHNEKMILAECLLEKISKAKLVITSRLHTALPCLALKTPLIFIHDNIEDIRFSGLLKFMKAYTHGDKIEVDWNNYIYQENEELNNIIKNIEQKIENWIKDDKKIYDSKLMDYKDTDSKDQEIYPKDIKLGNSIISVCMNRNHHLEQSLPTWLATNPNEIIIVDWGSSVSIEPIINKYKSDKIKLVTINNVNKWILTKPYNLAAQLSSYSNILKLDCDSFLESNFFSYHNLEQDNVFFAGDWKKSRNDNEKHTNGIVYLKRKDFFNVGGYNEYIITYGYDDCDLYNRLEKNLKRLLINLDTVKHLEHSNEDRMINQVLSYNYKLDVEIEKNRLISELNIWGGNFSIFKLDKLSDNKFTGQIISSCQLDQKINDNLLEKAIKNRKYAELKSKKKLFINTKNGLGNRLRALASAYIVAKEVGRQLVIIWVPDEHCEAKFTDLFKLNFLFKDVILVENFKKDKSLDISKAIQYNIEENENRVIYDYFSSKNKYIDDTIPQDIYIISACILNNKYTNWAKECTFLRSLETVDDIANNIYKYIIENNIYNAIGVHIRMGQNSSEHSYEDISRYSKEEKESVCKWRTSSHWTVFLREMDNILEKNPNQKFFVCCDNEEAYKNILSDPKYQKCIFYTKKNVYDRSLEQIKSGLIDLILLSKTQYILGSNWSSFSEMALRLSGKQMKLAGVDFK